MRIAVMVSVMLLAAVATAQQAPSGVIVGGESTYVVRAGDTMASIAGHAGMSVSALTAINRFARPQALTPGQRLAIDNPHLAVVDPTVVITINIPQRMMFVLEGDHVSAFPVTVGQRTWPTPSGAFKIIDKERNPVWDVPVAIQREMRRQGRPVVTRVEPSPANPLGAHWLRLSIPGLGIHGTNAPSSIYRYASHGCIRMHPDDVAALFERTPTGTTGVLLYQPVVLAVINDRVWIEAHPDPYRLVPDPLANLKLRAVQSGIDAQIDWPSAAAAIGARAGRPTDVTTSRSTP